MQKKPRPFRTGLFACWGQNRRAESARRGSGRDLTGGGRTRGQRRNRRAEAESTDGGTSADRLGGEVRASRLWPCGRHAHTDTLIRTPMRDSLVRVPMCDSLIRAPEHDTSYVHPCGTLSYRSLARHPCGTPSCGYPCAIPSYGRPARLSTYVRPRTTLPPPPELPAAAARGVAHLRP